MKVSELWLREIVNPKVDTQQWMQQFIQMGLEVDSVETVHNETVLTLKVPPNRSDCLSMEGLAREWACANQLPFEGVVVENILPTLNETVFPVHISAPMDCPRYAGRIIQNIKSDVDSPDWLKDRLEKAGIRSVSPVVDVTNYVMLEMGQPLHAFDLAKVDSEINVRKATSKESIVTLEGKTLNLDKDTLIIADKTKPLAIAGVIGGLDSGVSEKTKNIFLESAYFEPVQIRKTAKKFKLRTESSLRFEKGIDANLQMRALERATELLVKIVGGNVGPLLEVASKDFLRNALIIPLRTKRIAQVLGINLDVLEIAAILTRLGLKLKTTEFGWEVLIPSFRPDLNLEIDLIEEIARVYGFAQIPATAPMVQLNFEPNPENQIPLSQFKNILRARGYSEAINYSFIAPEMQSWFGNTDTSFILSNPISAELSMMRKSLIPGLLQNARYNQDRQISRLRLFEIGVCFQAKAPNSNKVQAKGQDKAQGQVQDEVQETNYLSGLVQGTVLKEQWGQKTQKVDFFDVKNDIESLIDLKSAQNKRLTHTLVFKPLKDHPLLNPAQAVEIYYQDEYLGILGSVHPALLKTLDLQAPVVVFELLTDKLKNLTLPTFQEISKFPSIRRDIAITVDEHVLADDLISAIVKSVGSLLRDVWIFDVYQGKGIEPGRKSVAIGLLLQHPSRTLVEEEVNEVMNKVVSYLAKEYQAILRE